MDLARGPDDRFGPDRLLGTVVGSALVLALAVTAATVGGEALILSLLVDRDAKAFTVVLGALVAVPIAGLAWIAWSATEEMVWSRRGGFWKGLALTSAILVVGTLASAWAVIVPAVFAGLYPAARLAGWGPKPD